MYMQQMYSEIHAYMAICYADIQNEQLYVRPRDGRQIH